MQLTYWAWQMSHTAARYPSELPHSGHLLAGTSRRPAGARGLGWIEEHLARHGGDAGGLFAVRAPVVFRGLEAAAGGVPAEAAVPVQPGQHQFGWAGGCGLIAGEAVDALPASESAEQLGHHELLGWWLVWACSCSASSRETPSRLRSAAASMGWPCLARCSAATLRANPSNASGMAGSGAALGWAGSRLCRDRDPTAAADTGCGAPARIAYVSVRAASWVAWLV